MTTMFSPNNFKYTIGDYNFILDTDGYKPSHPFQYPPNTKYIFSYGESRGGEYDTTVFFGLQYYLKEFLSRPITKENIEEAEDILLPYGAPFYKEGWEYILNKHGGYIPIEVSAVPEGLVLPVSNYLWSVINTDEKCPWPSSHIETGMLRTCWYGTTVATQSYHIKKMITKFFVETASEESMNTIEYRLHDFGARGVSSYESSGVGGMAHLLSFRGTDTIQALRQARRYYYEPMAGATVPAMEHSSVTTWGRDGEKDSYANMIEQFGRKGAAFSIVCDSYDTFNAVDNIFGRQLKWQIEECGGTLVVRPDSGVPHEIVFRITEILGDRFGYEINNKGYRVLKPCVRILQGDGICYQSIHQILSTLKDNGWSAENVFFGMGGQMLQKLDRDTQKFAMKASWALIGDRWVEVFKDPITDSVKKSKRGHLTLYRNRETGKYFTGVLAHGADQHYDIIPSVVFRNGELLKDYTFQEVRNFVI